MTNQNKSYLMITVDVEDLQIARRPDDFENFILGDFRGERYGIEKIMDICDSFGFKAVFFIDVLSYENSSDKLKSLFNLIKKRGHDLQLHLHLDKVFPGKTDLTKYSFEQQNYFISHAKDIFHKLSGSYPIAYRSGAYFINDDTAKSLIKNNIFIDSSMFYKNSHCKTNYSINKVVKKYNLVEFPVTVFLRKRYLYGIKLKESIIKTDINHASLKELLAFKEHMKFKSKVMNLFMHSYSFLKLDLQEGKSVSVDSQSINKFILFLRVIKKDKDIKVITMKDFNKIYTKNPQLFYGEDSLPIFKTEDRILELIKRRMR